MEVLAYVHLIVASIFILIAPGIAWSYIFFKDVNILERIVLSFGMSIAMVSLTIYILNSFFGVKINLLNMVVVVSFLISIPVIYKKCLTFIRYNL